ncbi:hypothetical protein EV421DRAFT_1780748 [Armillaria borealis]|uniref:(4-O-methyl)-D-glucuronate--lignin esterase n=1 Tax=Armillaria borealis TaxID=47425 RepID=A0AA39JZ35_9AGAR|nr:hypothetical protein EV421DRAFT_1780748 [Armillaria borealis]
MKLLVFLGLLAAASLGSTQLLPKPADLPIIPVLPDPFTFRLTNQRVNSRADWPARKKEIFTLVQQYLYGYYPERSLETVRTTRSGNNLTINVSAGGKSASFAATLSFPSGGASASHPVPVVINPGSIDNNAFLNLGVALATFDTNSVAIDSTARTGVFWTLYGNRDIGTLTAWAWGYHRVLDAIEQVVPEIDAKRVGVTGCSRWGKGALAAGIFDERITLTMPMSSGAEGIGPWRFYYESQGAAEKIQNIYGAYPYWSNTVLGQFVNITGNSSRLPFDAHDLVSLVAPRSIIWDEGSADWWTNPEGVASVVFGASKIVFNWLGVGSNVGVHVRQAPDNGHCGLSGYSAIQPFLQKTFFGTPSSANFSDFSPFPPHPEAYPWSTHLPPQ